MKQLIDYQSKRLLKDNVLILSTLLVVLVLFIFSLVFFLREYKGLKTKISSTSSDIKDLTKKKDLIDYKKKILTGDLDLDKVNAIFSALIPPEEDYFSIVLALEKLSQKSNFIITGYNLNVANKTAGRLSLVIEGSGDSNTFLEFLKNYNFGGGRLITIDKIDYNQGQFLGTKITLNLYSGKSSVKEEPFSEFTEDDKKLIQKILQKVEIQLKSDENSSESYPTKSNPF